MGRKHALAPVIFLPLVILGGCLGTAAAQEAPEPAPASVQTPPGGQAQSSQSLPPGTIPQPTIASPGVITGITLGELYSDNLTLAASGQPKQTGWITEVQPFLKSAYSGPRFSGIFDYSLTGYLYKGQSQHNQLAQKLSALGTFVILPQHLFLDGTATYGRQIINNEQPAGSGTFFLDNNHANVAMGTLSPYWVQNLGNVGTMTLRYTRGRVVYNTRGIPAQNDALLNGIPNVTSNAVQFSVVSPEDQTLGWNLGYSEQRLEPDSGSGVQFAVAKLGTSLQVSTDTHLLADVGKENKFLPDGTVQELGAGFWDAGLEWSSTLDDFRVLAGHRFYGRSFELSWTHLAALLTTNLSYMEQPTDYNQQLLGLNPGTALTSPYSIPRIPSLTERQVYLSKRLSGSVIYSMPQSALSLTVYDELRTYFVLNSSQERVADAQLSWWFNIGVFTTLTPTYGWQRYQFQSGQISYNHFAQLALVHQFNPSDSGSIRLRHDSSNVYYGVPGAHGYGVNVVFLQWTHLF